MTETSRRPASRRETLAMGLSAAAVAAAGRARAADGGAPYDLVIKGGRVIDPDQGVNTQADVAIRGGRVAYVAPGIPAGAAAVLDARDRLVVPGLIDIHTHCTGFPRGPVLSLEGGVTAWVDAGHKGADNVGEGIAVVRAAPQLGSMLINIGRHGMGGGDFRPDMSVADVAACRAAIAANRDVVIGVKARVGREQAGENDVEVIRRAQEATAPFGVPVMVHIGNSFSPVGRLIDMLKPGDIVTHILAPPPHNIFDADGRIIPEVFAARARGVRFDVGHGRIAHWGWDLADQAQRQGFVPDTTSTDWTQTGHDEGVLSMPTQMSNLLAVGLPLEQVVAMATINPARCFPIYKGRGTLRPGAPADVAVLELRRGTFDLFDSLSTPTRRTANQKLFATATVVGGKIAWRRPG